MARGRRRVGVSCGGGGGGGGGGGRGHGGRGEFLPGRKGNISAMAALMGAEFGICGISTEQIEAVKSTIESSDVIDPNRFMKMINDMDGDVPHLTGSVEIKVFESFLEAASVDRIDTSEWLIEQIQLGMTPLAVAVIYLLYKGGNLNKQDSAGFTPMHYATKEGNDALVRLLLSKGASADISSCEGTPLHVAVSHGELEIINILLQHKIDPNKGCKDLGTPMTAAVLCAEDTGVAPGKVAESVALKCMRLLVKAGSDLNHTTPDTPLVLATSKGLSKCVKYLLEVGADANIPKNDGGGTPLEIAADYGRTELVEILFPYTKPIQGVSNWSVDGIIAHVQSKHLKDKGKQSDKDNKVKQKEDTHSLKFSSEDKVGHKDKKAKLNSLGAKAVEGKDYAGASNFYKEAVKLDPADDSMLYSHATTDSVRLRPNWRKGEGSTSARNAQEAVGSMCSCQISDENGSGPAIVAQDLVNEIVQIFVKVLDYPSISIQLDCNSSVREMVCSALAKHQICLPDVYVKCDGRMVSSETTLLLTVTNSTFIIVPRLRGGALSDDAKETINVDIEFIPLRELIADTGDNLFEVIYFKDPWATWLKAHFVVFLARVGRSIYRMLFRLIESYHGRYRCVKPFTIDNIVYFPEYECLSFIGVGDQLFSTENYLKNLENTTTILDQWFRYNPSKLFPQRQTGIHELNLHIGKLPRLLLFTVNELKVLVAKNRQKRPAETGVTKQWRSQYLLGPAGKSSPARTALILSVDLQFDYMTDDKQKDFKTGFGLGPDWMSTFERIPPMKQVLDHPCIWDPINRCFQPFLWDRKSYGHESIYGRNWLSHSNCGLDAKEAEVILTYLRPEFLSRTTKYLLCEYVDPPPPGKHAENRTRMIEILDMA